MTSNAAGLRKRVRTTDSKLTCSTITPGEASAVRSTTARQALLGPTEVTRARRLQARANARSTASSSESSASGLTTVSRVPLRRTRVIRHVRRSEEHTSELQSRPHLVCRLLLEQ